jgi:hypothetical protein
VRISRNDGRGWHIRGAVNFYSINVSLLTVMEHQSIIIYFVSSVDSSDQIL